MTDFGQSNRPAKAPASSNFRKKMRRFRKNIFVSFLIDLAVVVGVALVLSLLIKTFLLRSFFIPSGSMLETLQIDDRIMVNELVPDVIPLQRGDVVVFKDPGGWLGVVDSTPKPFLVEAGDWFLSAFGITAPDSAQHLVKRVIGVGGDHVKCCDADGKITINGKAITEPYIAKGAKPSSIEFDVKVPEGSYWVMGDNRYDSADSRYNQGKPGNGFVPIDNVVGRAFVVSWPLERWSWLDNYPEVFANVD